MAVEHIPWASYPTATCPKKCRYLDNHHICNYYLITGQRRPCQAGSGCTVADAGRKLRPWEIPIVANDGALGEDWGADQETRSLAALGMTESRRPGKKRVQWDTEEGRRLREQGLFCREIAERLGVSESVVSAWAREHWQDIKVSRRRRWDTEEGRRLREQGLSCTQIAKRLGLSDVTVSAYAREHWGDIHVPLQSMQAKWDVEKGKALWAAGASDDEIAAACGISRSAVASYRRRKWGYINEKKERKIVPRPVTWDTAVGLELYRAGKTDTEIAQRVGVGAQAVARYRRKHWKEKGGQEVARKVSWDEKRGFCMYLNGDTDQKIADACGAPSVKAVGDYRRAHWAAFPRNRETENEPGGVRDGGSDDMTTLQITDPEERLDPSTQPDSLAQDDQEREAEDAEGDDWDDVIADVVAGLEGMDALSVGLLIMRMGIWLEEPTYENRAGLAAAARLLAKQMAKNEP